MAIKRYYATKDNTISNMFLSNLSDRGINGNTGQSDILEVFSIFGQASSSSLEQARILIEFPIDQISADRDSGLHPASGVEFFLNLYNAPHSVTTPEDFVIEASPVIQPWDEGYGLDMENWLDAGPSTWASCSLDLTGSSQVWAKQGGDTYSNFTDLAANIDPKTMFLSSSTTDLSINITDYVEEWIKYIKTPASSSIKIVFAAGAAPPTNGTKIKIRSADTQDITYRFDVGAIEDPNVDNTGNIESDLSVLVDTTGLPGGQAANQNMNDVLQRFANAIAHVNGHHGKIATSVDTDNNTITLTQKTAGESGNTKVTVTVPEGGAAISLKDASNNAATSFTGGVGRQNNGLLVKLSGSYEDGSMERSFYTKRFFARGSQFYFKRPVLEVRWDSRIKDDRGNIATANPALSNADNTNTLYYHNYVNGVLTDLPSLPNFALTTDKELGTYATLLSTNDNNSVTTGQTSPLDTAFLEFEFGDFSNIDTSPAGAATTAANWLIFSHTNPTTSEVQKYYFLGLEMERGRPLADRNKEAERLRENSNFFPIHVAGNQAGATPFLARQTAEGLANVLNDHPGFNSNFFARPVGAAGKVRVQSRLQGDAGGACSLTMFRSIKRSDSSLRSNGFMAKFTPAFDQNIASDSLETKAGDDGADSRSRSAAVFLRSIADAAAAQDQRLMLISTTSLAWTNSNYDLQVIERKFSGQGSQGSLGQSIVATKESTGVYKASFKVANNINQDILYEKWWLDSGHNGVALAEFGSGLLRGHNGSVPVKVKNYYDEAGYDINNDSVVNITNLKSSYTQGEKVKLNVFIRNKIENQNVYSKMMGTISPLILENAHYQIKRITDDLIVVPYSTGSAISYTGLGYNEQGCNFVLDTSYLESNYAYEISFCCVKGSQKIVLDDKFKFRVD